MYWIWFGGTNLVSCFGFASVWWCGFWVVLGECVVGCYSGVWGGGVLALVWWWVLVTSFGVDS